MTAGETWRDQLVALGYVTEARKYDDAHVDINIDSWEDVLKLLAEREARKDTDSAKIITGLLALLDVEYERVNEADGRALEAMKRADEAVRVAREERSSSGRLRAVAEASDRELIDLRRACRTEQNAAQVGHQVGAFIGAGRKVIKVAELDLPEDWQS